MTLFVYSIAHMLVDAVCAAAIFGPAANSAGFPGLVLLYNTLAFSTQCAVGLLTDRLQRHDRLAALSMFTVLLGFLLPLPAVFRVALAGCGNSVFHVCGGTVTLKRSGGKAGPLGVFVAPGCVGLALGTIYPNYGGYFAAALALCAAAVLIIGPHGYPETVPNESETDRGESLLTVLLLIAAVAVRAIGGTAVSFPWKTGTAASLITTLFVFLGKTAGGCLCDRAGARAAAWISVPLAAVCIAFFPALMLPSLVSQFLINLTMPVTLWLIYRAMPDSPGLAFGLSASALWPGTIAGQLLTLAGQALWICILICFTFGLFAVLYSARHILKGEKK